MQTEKVTEKLSILSRSNISYTVVDNDYWLHFVSVLQSKESTT